VSTQAAGFSRSGFVKSYVIPALWVFLIPAFSLGFFRHVQTGIDREVTDSVVKQIQRDRSLSDERRTALIAYFQQVPLSRRFAASDAQFAKISQGFTTQTRFAYFTFRWMIRLSIISMISSLAVFVIAALSVLCSLRSQLVQYYSLASGWHLLRVFALAQVLMQGGMALALSYWVPAFWFDGYSERLILVVGVLAVMAGAGLVKAIFQRLDDRFELSGVIIKRTPGSLIWQDLDRICAKVGSRTPHRIVAGIDDAFFVTEHPVTVNGNVHEGRTLYVSLPLLKALNGTQADAVMAHEMAHFSGEDTLYSRKIGPLLARYQASLSALHSGFISIPVFYFMLCFRSLFEISLKRLSRQREFRADRIASEAASREDIVNALLRTSAYSQYRSTIEQKLFDEQQKLDVLNISQRVEAGFKPFASAFVSDGRALGAATSHPFDSHPSFKERADAVNVKLSAEQMVGVVGADVDGRWYQRIENAETLERDQWAAYEERFRNVHEEALAWRYVPETDAERAVVLAYFPEVSIDGRFGRRVVFTYEGVQYSKWSNRVRFDDITKVVHHQGTLPSLRLTTKGGLFNRSTLPLYLFSTHAKTVVETFAKYYGRHLAMKEHVSKVRERRQPPAQGSEDRELVATSG
jgi:Zn-dependent protease with chaperone function